MKSINIALAGNPNSGKTTLFNNLTGSHQHVGNYPGVTVERKEGVVHHKNHQINIVDLPGTYSLTAYSPDEVVARNVIINEKPDVVVNVVDASNLERNLYLTAQMKELGVPIILVLNMVDVSEHKGVKIDSDLLSTLMGLSIVRTVGVKNEGTKDLLDTIIKVFEGTTKNDERPIRYSPEIEHEIKQVESLLPVVENRKITRWTAIKLLEKDSKVYEEISVLPKGSDILRQVEKGQQNILNATHDDSEMAILEGRYALVRGATKEAVSYQPNDRLSLTEKIDKVLLNRFLGLPIFLGMMWLLFQLTFTLGGPPMDLIDTAFGSLGEWVAGNMSEGLLKSLVVDGIIGGVGGVIIFMPNIILLFLGIALLEGTGYMSRAAFVMDKIMHRVGLHGKSFVPMLIGFGCTVPAIMATRTLENDKDRLVTMLVAPLMSCGARLPVYTLLIAAFFHESVAGNILFSIYIIGIILAIVMAKVFRKWLLPGESEPFIMELPAYKLPTLKNILLQMWERTWLYLKKAGTIILVASIVVWALFTFPMVDFQGNEFESSTIQMEQSYAGRIGKAIEPVIAPLGFDWKTGVALTAGFAAKEVVVSTMGTLYSIEDEDGLAEEENSAVASFSDRARQQSGFTPLTAYCLMLFTLIYVPCMAVIAVIKRETNSWKWPLFTIAYTCGLAWIVCFVVYRGGLLLGIGV
ncbi:MAG: ferrous iron transport protein B [Bacillota bacterium]|nr:ferrous iron transport protein B [Bacillota bacterium]